MSKRKLIDTHEPEGEGPETPYRTQVRRERKRAKAEMEELVRRLTSLSRKALLRLDLNPELHRAIVILAGMGRTTGIARQRGYVIRLVRQEDVPTLTKRVDEVSGAGASQANQSRLERWRARLIREGDEAVQAFLEDYPRTERQRLRQIVRAAVAEEASGTSGKRFRELYQFIKEAFGDPGDDPGDSPDADVEST